MQLLGTQTIYYILTVSLYHWGK